MFQPPRTPELSRDLDGVIVWIVGQSAGLAEPMQLLPPDIAAVTARRCCFGFSEFRIHSPRHTNGKGALIPMSQLQPVKILKPLLIILSLSAILFGAGTELSAQAPPSAPDTVSDSPNQNAGTSEGPPEAAQTVDVTGIVDDQNIQQRLQRVLKASGWFENAEVRVNSGVVFLKGTTKEDRYFEWAENVSRNTQDVVAVVNDIAVNDTLDLHAATSHVGTSLNKLWRDFLKRLPLLLAGVVVLIVTWLAARIAISIVGRMAESSRLRNSLRDLLKQLTICGIWLTGFMVASVVVFPGMTPGKILTVLGLSSVAIGFAFKDIFENFFAGVLILWKFPFDKGDFIECGDITGKVEDITSRMTEIRQTDGELVVVPHAMLFKKAVHVLTNRKSRRVTVICGVAYDEDVDTSRDVIRKAVENCSSIDHSHDVEIFAQEFASSSINFEVTWWTGSTPLEIRQSRDEVVASVKRALDTAGIEIPFPYRTLTFKEPLQTLTGHSATSNSEPAIQNN